MNGTPHLPYVSAQYHPTSTALFPENRHGDKHQTDCPTGMARCPSLSLDPDGERGFFRNQWPGPEPRCRTPRRQRPRGELAADEKATIDLFERTRESVVYITTSSRGARHLDAQRLLRPARHRFRICLGRCRARHHQFPTSSKTPAKRWSSWLMAVSSRLPSSACRSRTTSLSCASRFPPSVPLPFPSAPATIFASGRRSTPSAIRSASTGR